MSPTERPDPGRPDPEPAIELYSSWRGIVSSTLTPFILIALPVWAMATRRVHPIAVAVALVGCALAAVALLDYPWSTRFGPRGIARRCALRTQHIRWDDVDGLARSREPRRLRRSSEDADPNTKGRIGGVVVLRGRRTYLCTDRPESRDEHAALLDAVGRWAPTVPQRLPPPPESTPPTTLYRRRRDDG